MLLPLGPKKLHIVDDSVAQIDLSGVDEEDFRRQCLARAPRCATQDARKGLLTVQDMLLPLGPKTLHLVDDLVEVDLSGVHEGDFRRQCSPSLATAIRSHARGQR